MFCWWHVHFLANETTIHAPGDIPKASYSYDPRYHLQVSKSVHVWSHNHMYNPKLNQNNCFPGLKYLHVWQIASCFGHVMSMSDDSLPSLVGVHVHRSLRVTCVQDKACVFVHVVDVLEWNFMDCLFKCNSRSQSVAWRTCASAREDPRA